LIETLAQIAKDHLQDTKLTQVPTGKNEIPILIQLTYQIPRWLSLPILELQYQKEREIRHSSDVR